MSGTKITVRDIRRNELISIDPKTDCQRCGIKVFSKTQLPEFKICPLHCVFCNYMDESGNTGIELKSPDNSKFEYPICPNCYYRIYDVWNERCKS